MGKKFQLQMSIKRDTRNQCNCKILVLLLVLVTNSLWAGSPFSKINDSEKIIELSENTDLLIEGKIIDKEYVYINRRTKELIELEDITEENLGKIIVVTKFTVKVLEDFKKNINRNKINIWILGGKLSLNGVEKVNLTTHTAYPLLDNDDIMIMGLNSNESKSPINISREDYIEDYHFYEAEKLQIPSSNKMIEEVEEGELKKAKKHVYNQKLKSLEEPSSTEFPSYEELDNNFLEASIQKNKNIDGKKKFIKKLKKSLRRRYE